MSYIVKATRRRVGDEVALVSRPEYKGDSIFSDSGEPETFPNRRAGQLAIAKWIEWQQGNIAFDNFRVEEAPDDRDHLDTIPEGHLIEDGSGDKYVVVVPEDGLDRDSVPVVNMDGVLIYLDGDMLFKDLGHIDPTSITTDKE